MYRLFVAIVPPEPVREQLLDLVDESLDLRWVPADNLHLTLRFIGEVSGDVAEDLAARLATISRPQFELRLAGLGTFNHRGSGTLWMGAEPREALVALAASVEQASQRVGIEPEHRTFHPHLSLARWSRGQPDQLAHILARYRFIPPISFAVDEFCLIESRLSRHGASYLELVRYPLI